MAADDNGREVDPPALAAWRGRVQLTPVAPVVLEVVIMPRCDRCGMPAVLADDGRWVHAEAADAVFCSLINQTDHPRGRHA